MTEKTFPLEWSRFIENILKGEFGEAHCRDVLFQLTENVRTRIGAEREKQIDAESLFGTARSALGVEMALGEIELNCGRYYDVEVATTCLRLFREKGYQLKLNVF